MVLTHRPLSVRCSVEKLKLQDRPKDYYRILGVGQSTSDAELKRTYRVLSLR